MLHSKLKRVVQIFNLKKPPQTHHKQQKHTKTRLPNQQKNPQTNRKPASVCALLVATYYLKKITTSTGISLYLGRNVSRTTL